MGPKQFTRAREKPIFCREQELMSLLIYAGLLFIIFCLLFLRMRDENMSRSFDDKLSSFD